MLVRPCGCYTLCDRSEKGTYDIRFVSRTQLLIVMELRQSDCRVCSCRQRYLKISGCCRRTDICAIEVLIAGIGLSNLSSYSVVLDGTTYMVLFDLVLLWVEVVAVAKVGYSPSTGSFPRSLEA